MYRIFITCVVLLITLTGCGDKSATPATSKDGVAVNQSASNSETAKTAAVKHPWASFKVGSFVKTKSTTTVNVAGKPINTVTEMKQTLVELTAEKAVLETEASVMGNTSKTKIDLPLNVVASNPTLPSAPANSEVKPKESQESLTINGKTLNCKVTEIETEQGGNKVTSKTWMSEDVPGNVVKTVSKMSGATSTETTSELIDFEAK
jgi:hypothetical protein